MIAITKEEFNKITSHQKVRIKCDFCGEESLKRKNVLYRKSFKNADIDQILKDNRFCNYQCLGRHNSSTGTRKVKCTQCTKIFIRANSQATDKRKKNKENNFCSHTCAATYNNTHKVKGTRVSKLEVYLAKNLILLYPDLEFHFNKKDSINSELDIYIPILKLAFELNGIFHYEPIYGEEKLKSIQNNDERKVLACAEKGISLCIIDSTSLKYFKEEKAKKFLHIICNIINSKLVP